MWGWLQSLLPLVTLEYNVGFPPLQGEINVLSREHSISVTLEAEAVIWPSWVLCAADLKHVGSAWT